VVIGSRTIGQPASPREAAQMLRLLSGRQHKVLTGLVFYILPDSNLHSTNRSAEPAVD